MPAEELLFGATPGFGKYKQFLGHAVAHPAKMNTNLLEFLIKNFTEKGEVVLDSMAGSYSTCIVSGLLGRHGVGVDLEEKFFQWGLEAKKKLLETETLRSKGQVTILKGDARQLSELLKQADTILTSPPFASITIKKEFKSEGELEEFAKKQWVFRHGRSLEATKKFMKKSWKGYPENPANIGNLPHGKIDVIVTSLPYSEGIGHDSGDNASEQFSERLKMQRKYTRSMTSEGNIAKLKHGSVDAIVTSPPYADGTKGPSRSSLWERLSKDPTSNRYGRKTHPTIGEGYGKSAENIGNLPFVDAVITSPPYSEQAEAGNKDPDAFWNKAEKTHGRKFTDKTRRLMKMRFEEPENIGNLKKETYLEAMAKVYSEMWKVLKPQGKAIIIIKPFIRQKKVVDLPLQTWLLMEKVGFNLVKLYKLRLKTVSFWRLLYSKKYPDVPKIAHEYILIAQKGDDCVGSVHVEKEVIA